MSDITARFALSALLMSASICAWASDPDIKLHAAWRVSIESDGHIVQMKANDRLIDSVHAQIDPIVRHWVFVPGQINGVATATETNVIVDFTLLPAGDDRYTVQIDDARTGSAVASGTQSPPTYPRNEMFKGHNGLAVLDVEFDANGHVVDTKLAEGAPAVADDFVKAASAAIKHWTFLPEVVGGRALAGHALTPMCFTVERNLGPRPPKELPGSPKCDWQPAGAHAPLQDGEVLAIAPAARLRDDVTTHTM